MRADPTLRRRRAVALVLASGCWAGPALADEELFKKSNCMACHAVDQKRLGPSMKQVAQRYAGDGAAAARLALKIREGGGGAWGELAMPPQSQVAEGDAKLLVAWILSLR